MTTKDTSLTQILAEAAKQLDGLPTSQQSDIYKMEMKKLEEIRARREASKK